MSAFSFETEHTDGAARAGVFNTPHGAVTTPCFMPVGTLGTVKALGLVCVVGGVVMLNVGGQR